jgi:hypothetical protein
VGSGGHGLVFAEFGGNWIPGAGDEQAGSFGDGLVEKAAGDLLADELVVGFVVEEGLDDVVAIGPGVEAFVVALAAIGFAEADKLEPVAGVAFGVARRLKEEVDGGFVGALVVSGVGGASRWGQSRGGGSGCDGQRGGWG